MNATSGPSNPCQSSIGILGRKLHGHEGWQVMLIGIAAVGAVALEEWKIDLVRNNFQGQFPIHLEPLGPFPPLINCDVRAHFLVVSPAPNRGVFIVCFYVTLGGVHEVSVDCGEVKQWNACF